MTSPTKQTGTDVTMASESFRPFHMLVFNYVEALLSLLANRNHPFRGPPKAHGMRSRILWE